MGFIDGLGRDLVFAIRLMRQAPVASTVAFVSLALGIGANIAIFALVNALMVKALPVHEPQALVQVQLSDPRGPTTSLTNPQWEYFRDHEHGFAGLFATGTARFNLSTGGEVRPAQGIWASAGYLDVLGVTPILGRGFVPEDDRRGGGPGGPVTVISHGFWQREFGSDPDILGRTLLLDGHRFTVVGVTPPEFFGTVVGRTFDLLVPLGAEPIVRGAESSLDRRGSWWLTIIGRLKDGDTREAAEARVLALQPALRQATMPTDWQPRYLAQYLDEPFELVPAATGTSPLRQRYSRPLYVLLGIVGFILLIACANMANLLLAMSAARRQEMAIRLSLGASRARLIRQLLIESVLLSASGALAGLVVAGWGARALVDLLSTRTAVVSLDLAPDWRVLAFAVGAALVTGLLFGVGPALQNTRVAPADALRDHARGVIGGGRAGLGHVLLAGQVALSFVLVLGASLFVRTLVGLTSQEVGFDASRVLVGNLDLRRTAAAPDGRLPLFERVEAAVAAVPLVEAAALSYVTPVGGSTWNMSIVVPGFANGETDTAFFNAVSPGYLRTMGTSIVTGRDFSSHDVAAAPSVAIVNGAFARKFFAGENPVGRTFTLEGGGERPERYIEVVGLVADAAYRTLRDPPPPTMYVPLAQEPSLRSSMRLAIRTAGAPTAAWKDILAAVTSVDEDIAVDLKPMIEDVNASVQQERLVASLSAFFGVLALLLAALGLYGVMSHTVARRTNEIGIRMALGAEPGRVMRLVLGRVALVMAAGLVAGAGAAALLGGFVAALLFNLAPTDPTMVAVTMMALVIAAALAGALPARRAARIDPMAALREP